MHPLPPETVNGLCNAELEREMGVDGPAFDDLGFPIQADGASTVVDDLYFIGVPFLRNRKSSLLLGVGEDAPVIAGTTAERVPVA